MRRVNRTTVFTLCITLVALLAAGFAAQHFRLFERTWFQISQMWHPANPDAINLGDYRAVMQGKVDDNTRVLDARDAEQLTLGINQSGNKGFEGLAYDSVGKRLFVAKERDPMLIYEVRGFPQANPQQPYATHVVSNPRRDARLFVRDLSSLQFDERTGHLLALSDESKLLLELGLDGQPISTLSLKKGKHGLTRSVPQAEGVAMDDEGTIYVVSEPNLFYVFKKPAL